MAVAFPGSKNRHGIRVTFQYLNMMGALFRNRLIYYILLSLKLFKSFFSLYVFTLVGINEKVNNYI